MHKINPVSSFPRIQIFQHASFEGPGCIVEYLLQRHYPFSVTKWYLPSHEVPTIEKTDVLIIMGGPMGVYEEGRYPWLKEEKAMIRSMVQAGKKVLGICLGAQLIAESLGAKVYSNTKKEIGWFPVMPVEVPEMPEELHRVLRNTPVVFHWHGDTFDLPEGALNYASSAGCVNQLFIWRKQVMGIQFHYEVTEASLKDMLQAGKEELYRALSEDQKEYIQPEEAILSGKKYISASNQRMDSLLDFFL